MQTIGERLEEARKKKGISIREAAEATKIRGDYLQKFESNQFDIGLTELYVRGFLRNYANYLKLPADRILNDYSALGRGDIRPRQPNREVYGRMDITVASATEAEAERTATAEEAPAEAAPVRAQPHLRGRTTLPTGPDPALLWKYAKWAGAGIVVFLTVLLLRFIFSSGPSSSSRRNSAASAVAAPRSNATQSYTLVALDTVFVRVTQRIGEDTDSDEIFKGTLIKGQVQTIPWIGPQNVWASAGENVQIEFNGRRLPLPFTGYSHGHMENPPTAR